MERTSSFVNKLPSNVISDLEKWKFHPELHKLLKKIEYATDSQRFFDYYAEASVARHLLHRNCVLAVDVPTIASRDADLKVKKFGLEFYIHIKRLNHDSEMNSELNITSRLDEFRKLEKPLMLSFVFCKRVTDPEIQLVYKNIKPHLMANRIIEGQIDNKEGETICEFEIKNWKYASHVQLSIVYSARYSNDEDRLNQKLEEAKNQFMPNAINMILMTGVWNDSIEPFKRALVQKFWYRGKHDISRIAGWFDFGIKEDNISFKIFCREQNSELEKIQKLFA